MPTNMKELAEEYYMHDFDSYDSLFDSWLDKKIAPDQLGEEYDEMKPLYKKWLDDHKLWKYLK